jgi:ATP-dependent DNA helicase RecQ
MDGDKMQEKKIVYIISDVLQGKITPLEGRELIRQRLDNTEDSSEYSRHTCAYRLCRTLYDIEKGVATWRDFAGHLRQCILFMNRRFLISQYIGESIRNFATEFKLVLEKSEEGLEVNALESMPSWFKGDESLERMYRMEPVQDEEEMLGDGVLYNLTGYKYYASRNQKIIIQESLNMEYGQTLLACLPTGGGKSLVWQLPAFYERAEGTTIVVVPTISLAIDQERIARKYFKKVNDGCSLPRAYYSGLLSIEKEEIYEGVKRGSIPILYISPEAILNSAFNDIILEAAAAGKVKRFVIDEAHIVVDWGSLFRTEFQFLSVFRRKLMRKTDGRLKTILLSATLTDRTVDILKDLFSEGENLIEIRADALRPEIMFFFDKNESSYPRRSKILEVLPLLPRPMIIYVNSPHKAEVWRKRIEESGFKSAAAFSGETSEKDRKNIIDKWDRDELDIIIANSAFGMGVNKRDIRTIIHCYMPESLNRYYQEVGRGGRDGFPSLSLWSVVPEKDDKEAFNLIKSSVLRAKSIAERWESLRLNLIERVSGDSFWVDVDCKPFHLGDEETGKRSANWNEYVLLFLYRKGLIDILDVIQKVETDRHHVFIKMKDIELLEDQERLIKHLEPLREEDRSSLNRELGIVRAIVGNHDGFCWAEAFTETYSRVEELCGGCPYCRKLGKIPYKTQGKFNISRNIKNTTSNLTRKLDMYLSHNKELFLGTDSQLSLIDSQLVSIVAGLINSGVKSIIFPGMDSHTWSDFLEAISEKECRQYSLFTVDEAVGNRNGYGIGSVCAVIFSDRDEVNDKIYSWAKQYIGLCEENKIIYVGPTELKIKSENKELMELKDGLYQSSNILL